MSLSIYTTKFSTYAPMIDGFKFSRHKKNKSSIQWRCNHWSTHNCPKRCSTDTEITMVLRETGEHSHGPEAKHSREKLEVQHICRKRCREEPDEKIGDIIVDELNRANIELLPREYQSMRQALYSERQKQLAANQSSTIDGEMRPRKSRKKANPLKMLAAIKYLVKGVEQPSHEVLQKEKQYEVRSYPSSKWVSTKMKSISHKEAVSKSFRKLFNYIQGENEGQIKVEMTAPVTTFVEPGAGPNCESTFTTSFYIPVEHQEKPPAPLNPEVFIEERPEMTVYVGTFGGFFDDEKWVKAGVNLTEAIGDESKFDANTYYTAGYDAPFKLIGRTNEIWFLKKSE